jgi:hypothetical protein
VAAGDLEAPHITDAITHRVISQPLPSGFRCEMFNTSELFEFTWDLVLVWFGFGHFAMKVLFVWRNKPAV